MTHHITHVRLEDMDDEHLGGSPSNALHQGAFLLSDEEKIEQIAIRFGEIMHILGLDLRDGSLRDTPRRVAKMYVRETFSGLNPVNKPSITVFDNNYRYQGPVIEKNIPVLSTCEHHFQPIIGKAHVAYAPSQKVVGLSKLNRIVEYYARRPQVQERLTEQIAHELMTALDTEHVAVYIEAKHMCVEARGVRHAGCSTVTTSYHGAFETDGLKNEFLAAIRNGMA